MNCVAITHPIRQIERDLEEWLGGLNDPFLGVLAGGRGFAPSIDLYEEEDAYVLRVELPGLSKADVELSVKDGVLSIKGHKKTQVDEKKGRRYHRRETWAGSFERRLSLPEDADPDKVSAEMKEGVLSLRLPKRPEQKPMQIDIQG